MSRNGIGKYSDPNIASNSQLIWLWASGLGLRTPLYGLVMHSGSELHAEGTP